MSARLRRALLLILLCILPVQSMAATLVPLMCAPHGTAHAGAVHHGGHGHAAEAHDHAAHHEGDAAGHDRDGHGHLCCHQFSSAAPAVRILPAPQDFRVYASAVPVLAPLHIPELPQRPPRG